LFARTGAFVSIALAVALIFAQAMAQDTSPPRDINAVLRAHDKELLAIDGVVGVYVGLLDDGKTPCLKVMLAEKSPEAERAIPKSIEGFPVVLEVTGEIRPLDK
jgi:hypothetical protein